MSGTHWDSVRVRSWSILVPKNKAPWRLNSLGTGIIHPFQWNIRNATPKYTEYLFPMCSWNFVDLSWYRILRTIIKSHVYISSYMYALLGYVYIYIYIYALYIHMLRLLSSLLSAWWPLRNERWRMRTLLSWTPSVEFYEVASMIPSMLSWRLEIEILGTLKSLLWVEMGLMEVLSDFQEGLSRMLSPKVEGFRCFRMVLWAMKDRFIERYRK